MKHNLPVIESLALNASPIATCEKSKDVPVKNALIRNTCSLKALYVHVLLSGDIVIKYLTSLIDAHNHNYL